MTDNDHAVQILSSTSWFRDAQPSLLRALAYKMIKEEIKDAQTRVFFWEGSIVDSILIIEEGTLIRSKAIEHDEIATTTSGDVNDNTMPLPTIIEQNEMTEMEEFFRTKSVTLDQLRGKGRVSGILRVIDQDYYGNDGNDAATTTSNASRAYATVRSVGHCIIWRIPAQDFLDVLSSDAIFAMGILRKVTQKMRTGSKSLRGMLKNATRTIKKSSSSNLDELGMAGHGDDDDKNNQRKTLVRVLCYDSTQWVISAFEPAVKAFNEASSSSLQIEMEFTHDRLSEQTATYAAGYDVACLFVNDSADANTLRILSMLGVRLVAMRCAGYDRVDVRSAKAHDLTVARVPAYSPYAVAEHAISLLMAINRKIPSASTRVKMANFTLDNSLLGMDIHGKTVGIMGTGKIGQILCKILNGFGAKLLCYDVFESDDVKKLGAEYVSKDEIFKKADVIFLMMPLLSVTKHTINEEVISKLKTGVLIVNTARGGLIDTKALIRGLQSGRIGGVGLDVLENEADYFFQDWSAKSIEDPELTSLMGNNRVVLTAHQAFFTKEAVSEIVRTTLENIRVWKEDGLEGLLHPNNCIPSTLE